MKNTKHDLVTKRGPTFTFLGHARRFGIVPHQLWTLPHAALAIMFLLVAALPAAAFTASDRDASFNEAVAAMKLGNYAIALEKFTILAEQGDLAAQYDLGWMRARGLGARTDNVAAYQWFSLVAKAGQELGRQALSDIRGRMSAAEIAEGERRAAAWRPNQMTR